MSYLQALVSDTHLKSMWLKGRKNRVQMHPEASQEGLKKGLQDFITSAVKISPIEEEKISIWAATITSAMEANTLAP